MPSRFGHPADVGHNYASLIGFSLRRLEAPQRGMSGLALYAEVFFYNRK